MACDWCGMASCPHGTIKPEVVDPVEVVAISDMDNDTFLKHMDARHKGDFVGWPLSTHPDRDDAWIGPYRAFHDRLHDIHHGQIDHVHLW